MIVEIQDGTLVALHCAGQTNYRVSGGMVEVTDQAGGHLPQMIRLAG